MLQIGVFVSGRGSNLSSIFNESLSDEAKFIISAVISNNEDCEALKFAESNNVFISYNFFENIKINTKDINVTHENEETENEEMPFEDSSFDVVFSNCVLEHVEGLDDMLAHVGRVLKPGGQFVFTVPTEDFQYVKFGALINF